MNARTAMAAAVLTAGLGLSGCQGDDEDALLVRISLPQQYVSGVAKATIAVDYSGTGASILSEGGGPACAFTLPGLDGDFADDRRGTLTIRTSGARALRGPADIAACRMKASNEDATAEDIHEKMSIRVAAAEDAGGKAIDVASRSARTAPGAAGGPMSPAAVEEAQEAAVKAAVAAAPPPAPRQPPPLDDGGVMPNAGSPRAGAQAAAQAAAAAPKQGAAAARPTAPPMAQNPVGGAQGPGGQDMGGNDNIPGNQDRDPSYDDSPADDDSVTAYTLEFFVQTPSRFGALQLAITHLGRSGGFIGRQDTVDCVSLVEAIVASNYVGERLTKVGLISLAGIRTPAAIMRCGFRTREPLSPGSFNIEVVDAADTDSDPIEPRPTVVISTITRR